jgi:hypothetical protein
MEKANPPKKDLPLLKKGYHLDFEALILSSNRGLLLALPKEFIYERIIISQPLSKPFQQQILELYLQQYLSLLLFVDCGLYELSFQPP